MIDLMQDEIIVDMTVDTSDDYISDIGKIEQQKPLINMVKKVYKPDYNVDDDVNLGQKPLVNMVKMADKDISLLQTSNNESIGIVKSQSNKNSLVQESNTQVDIKKNEILKQSCYSQLPDEFTYDGKYLYFRGTPVSNMKIEITGGEKTINNSGEERYFYKIICIIKNSIVIEKKIELKDIRKLYWMDDIFGLVKKTTRANFNIVMDIYINKLIESLDTNAISINYLSSGWKYYNNMHLYVTAKGVVGQPYIQISAIDDRSIEIQEQFYKNRKGFDLFIKMASITYDKKTSYVIMMYIILSYLYSVLKEINIVPKFLLALIGSKGSLKTSMALAMSQISENNVKINFNATQAGIEGEFRNYADSVLLIDDLMPSNDISKKRENERKLEAIVRAVGDSTGRKRNTDFLDPTKFDQDKFNYECKGGVLITGEYISGVESSLARMVILKVDNNSVNKEVLSFYQTNKKIISTFIYSFLKHVQDNYDRITSLLPNKFITYRSLKNGVYTNARLAEYYAQFRIASELILDYASTNNLLNEMESSQLFLEMENAIEDVLIQNNSMLVSENPSVMVAKAIIEAVQLGEVQVIPYGDKESYYENAIHDDGEKWYYVQSQIAQLYKNYINRNCLNTVSMSVRTISEKLYEANVASAFLEGGDRRYSKKDKKIGSARFIVLDKLKLFELAGENLI